mgnify:CR=1 FL=1
MKNLEDLTKWYQDFVLQTTNSRKEAERDRDYYDNKQWTSAEIATLNSRKQPVITVNRIKPKIDSLIGLEVRNRVDIKAFPRTPSDEEAAEGATDALRYVADNTDFDQVKTDAAYNLFIEGSMAGIAEVRNTPKGFEIENREIPWDRLIYDFRSTKKDYKDARFMGMAVWMGREDAKALFPDVDEGVLTAGDRDGSLGDTFDDKPKNLYFDSEDRVKLLELYYRDGGQWHHAMFTGAGWLVEPRLSPYLDEDGEPMNPIEAQSAFVDRDNNRYGVVRQMISIQDEINKRRSKALHLLSTRQVRADKGAVDDVREAKKQLNKPDGWLETNPGREFDILSTTDLAIGQTNLLQESKGEIDAIGANASVTGKEDRNLSGRAMQVRQEAGVVELTAVMDGLRSWEKRMYRQMWARIKQFWTEERWIRVTDDERNLKFVGLNRPVTAGEVLQSQGELYDATDPRANQIVHIENQVAELDMDIILEAVPDTVNLQSEQFELLANMFSANPNAIPMEMIVESSSLRNKDRILERLQGGSDEEREANAQVQQEAMALEKADKVADIQGKEAKAAKDQADATAQQIENMATASGLKNVVEALGGQDH